MGRIRSFLLKHRVKTLFGRVFRLRRLPVCTHRLLNPTRSFRVKPFSGFIEWADRLRTKAKTILWKNPESGRGYIRVGQEPVPVPKGHMAVYVGQKDGDYQRILVPVVYFNHPLFGDLLKESEKEYGFDHPGGITIPCRVSEFERVQTRIQAVQSPRKLLAWKGSNRTLMG